MYDEDAEVLVTDKDEAFKFLLACYPQDYTKRFGQEMLFAFQDLYQEEIGKNGKARFGFWFSLLIDTLQNAILQHVLIMKRLGLKRYFNINKFNVLGGVLLLPFLSLFAYDFLGRLVQGDFTHYNRTWNAAISKTILYNTNYGRPYVLWVILILAPVLAVLLNLFPIFNSLVKEKRLRVKTLFLANPLALVVILFGLFCLLVVYGHDFVPCTVHGVMYHGIGSIGQAISICRKT